MKHSRVLLDSYGRQGRLTVGPLHTRSDPLPLPHPKPALRAADVEGDKQRDHDYPDAYRSYRQRVSKLGHGITYTAKMRHTSDFPQRATGWVILVPSDFANILAKVRSEER
jgi:hypothetical protein